MIKKPLIPRFVSRGRPAWFCGFFVLCASAAIAADQEPSYNGRLLSQWLGDMRLSAPGSGPYEEAIRGMGTNAIPTLLKWMSYEPSPSELSSRIEEKVPHWRPITNLNLYPAQRGQRAGYAFGYLGAMARSTIPELTRLARTASNLERADRFAGALASIGPEAVPSLVSLATHSPPWTRWATIGALGGFADDPAVAAQLLPMLINCLSENDTNTDYPVTGRAEGVLVAMGPGVVVPALTNALQSASAFTRQRAIVCLSAFEPTNLPPTAVPALRAAMRDPDSEVRSIATSILRKMGEFEAPGANKDAR
jgi:HEAT repeat protein